jgi:hypothetical protein
LTGLLKRCGATAVTILFLTLVPGSLGASAATPDGPSGGPFEGLLVPGSDGRAVVPATSGRIFRTFSTGRSPIQPHVDFGLPWNQGWYCNDFLFNYTWNTNYVVGSFGEDECRNFFTFDLATLDRPVIAARLKVYAAELVGDPTERYGLYDVSSRPPRGG